MYRKILLSLIFFGLSISITKADTEHTLGYLQSFVKGIAYVGTFFSWLLLSSTISKKKGKYLAFNFLILIICGLIGISAIISGNGLSGYNDHEDEANSYITWGWTIIILNILPIILSTGILLLKNSLENKSDLNNSMNNRNQESLNP